MKEPCLTCRKKQACDKTESNCEDWDAWIFSTSKGRNSVQQTLMEYTEREE